MNLLNKLDQIKSVINVYDWSVLKQFPVEHLVEFQKYMTLKALMHDYDAVLLSPSHIVDEIWHTFMLLPQYYLDFCRQLIKVSDPSSNKELFNHVLPQIASTSHRENRMN